MVIINWPAVGATVLPNVGGWMYGCVGDCKSFNAWYSTLKTPSWHPPDWVFGTVWTSLYSGMGYASYLVWRDCGQTFGGRAALPMGLFASQLTFAWAWSPIFFGKRNLKWALVDMVALYANTAACGYYFYQVNETAGLLMAPCFAWLTFAIALLYRVYKDNPKQITDKSE